MKSSSSMKLTYFPWAFSIPMFLARDTPLTLEYNNSIEALENDFKREQISRDRLQMVKEGEEIYRLINQK